jgi:cytochrome c556
MRFLPLLFVAALAGCATTTETPGRAGPSLTAEQIVAARQAAFTLSASAFGGMRRTVEAGGEVKPLTMSARGLARWAETLPAMFPEGTQLPASRARPEIWQNRADFETNASTFQAATATLLQAAEAGDAAAFKTAYGAVGTACGACHKSYRAEPPR